MGDGENVDVSPIRESRYVAADLSPTSTKDLRGFYGYGMAAEIFAVCGVGKYRVLSFS
jgi:UMF1 family MFS transporter